MVWTVQLAGDSADLAALAQSLTDGQFTITCNSHDFVLTSDLFSVDLTAAAVRKKAEEIVAILSGTARLALDAKKAISVASISRQHEDGHRELFVIAEPAVIRLQARPATLMLKYVDGTAEVFHPADPVKQWLPLALENKEVASVFQILAAGPPDWVNLYRALELVAEDVDGIEVIVSKNWATKAQIRLFRHTAGSPGAVGLLHARHGSERTQPPQKPMTISEGRALITTIIHAWLREKTT